VIAGPGGAAIVSFTGPVTIGTPLSNQSLRRRDTDAPGIAIGSDIARYSITPELALKHYSRLMKRVTPTIGSKELRAGKLAESLIWNSLHVVSGDPLSGLVNLPLRW